MVAQERELRQKSGHLAAQVAAYREALTRFAEWEREQDKNGPAALGPRALRQALDWYADALDLATRSGSAGPGAPEWHLDDLVAWVRLWRKAWRAE